MEKRRGGGEEESDIVLEVTQKQLKGERESQLEEHARDISTP